MWSCQSCQRAQRPASPTGTAVVKRLQKSICFEEAAYMVGSLCHRETRCGSGLPCCITGKPSCQGHRGRRGVSYGKASMLETSQPCTINFFSQIQNQSSPMEKGLLLVLLCEDQIWKQCHAQEKLHELNWRSPPGWEPQTDLYWGARRRPRHTLRRVTHPEKAKAQLFNMVTHPQIQVVFVGNLRSRLTTWKQKALWPRKKASRDRRNQVWNLLKDLDLGYRKLVNSYWIYRIILV